MTVAKRLIPLLEFAPSGALVDPFVRGGIGIDYVEAAVGYLVREGAEEVWLRLVDADAGGAAGLFDPLQKVRAHHFVPLVAWGSVKSLADARLVTGLGADRVVVDIDPTDPDGAEQLIFQMAQSLGQDAVAVAVNVRRIAQSAGSAWELCDERGTGCGIDAVGGLLELAQAGAGELVLQAFFEGKSAGHPADLVERLSQVLPIQIVTRGQEREPRDLGPPLLMGADAVVTKLLSSGALSLEELKRSMREMGLAVRPCVPPYAQG